MKKILFVGDLRTVNNYGAVATTEALLKLLSAEAFDTEFKYIEFRSLYSPTPVNGFPKEKPTANSIYRRVVKSMIPAFVLKKIRQVLIRKNALLDATKDFVPYKYSQFESYYERMKSGQSLQYEKNLLDWADIVYINGEGNIVNGTDSYGKYRMGARYILFLAWLSKVKYNKPTLILNHTVDPRNYNAFEIISAVYPLLDQVLVRETLSLPVLREHGVNNARFVPDALFSYKPAVEWEPSEELKKQIDFSHPFICIGDSSGVKNAYSHVSWNVIDVFTEIIHELKNIAPQIIFIDGYNGNNEDINEVIRKNNIGYVNFQNCNYHDLLHVLQRSMLFISGRWHASILCTLANTPILLWGADSHKTRSLYTLLDYNYRFFEVASLPANIPELIDEARKIINDTDRIKENMKQKVAKYSNAAWENATILEQYVR